MPGEQSRCRVCLVGFLLIGATFSQAVTDMPAAYFAEELIEAYPDAKVILTTRDTESWFAYVPPSSYHNSLTAPTTGRPAL